MSTALLGGSFQIVNFDDLNASAGDVVLAKYQGFDWTGVSVYTNTPGFPGFNNGIVSPLNAVAMGGDSLGAPLVSSMGSSTPFNFDSAYLGAGWYDDLTVVVTGLLNGVQKFSQTDTVDTRGARLLTFNFTDVNKVTFVSEVTAATTDPYGCGFSGCSQMTGDGFRVTPVSVPEPASAGFIGLGLALLAAWRRLSRRRAA